MHLNRRVNGEWQKNLEVKAFTERKDEKLLFQADYMDKEDPLIWLLSFRGQAELLEPEEIRNEIRRNIECMKSIYLEKEERLKIGRREPWHLTIKESIKSFICKRINRISQKSRR